MSGICGLLVFDGTTPAADDLAAMTEPLTRRGPEGSQHWFGRQVAFGHTLLATTPEALIEKLPFCEPGSGCTITADARLDNREELLMELGLADLGRVIGDGELILQCYLRWHDECAARLLGDFAFAIWDPRSERLYCARDHMGMRQLTYAFLPGVSFTFATEPRAIASLRDRDWPINEGRIADFLGDLEGLDFTSTFYAGIKRLPPAHYLVCEGGSSEVCRYWKLEPGPPLKLGSDEAYAEAFLDLFSEAVRCRLRSAGPVGSMLSGGMDSSSIVAVASGLLGAEGKGPLRTFSASGPDPEGCAETRAIQAVISQPGLAPYIICHADLGDYVNDLIELTAASDEPFDGHMTMPRAVYLSAHRVGVKVVLDGASGDLALGAGTLITRQIRRGMWLRAWRNLRGEKAFYGNAYSLRHALFRAVRTAIVPNWIRWLRDLAGSALGPKDRHAEEMVSPGLALRTRFSAREQAYFGWQLRRLVPYTQERAHLLALPHLTVARERYDRVAAAMGIEPRDPFLDIRLLEFCLRLPGDQLLSRGWSKMVLRRAMKGLLPDEVRWRTEKTRLGWTFTKAMLACWPDWRGALTYRPNLERFVNICVVNEIRQNRDSELDGRVVSCLYLANWLDSASVARRKEKAIWPKP